MKTALRIGLSLAVAAGLLAALMAWGDVRPRDAADVLLGLRPEALAGAVGLHALVYLLRAVRFRLLVPPAGRPTLARALAVSSAHNLAAYVLPAKTGEATFVLYLRQVAGVPAARGLASLVVSRLLDLAVLAALTALACGWIGVLGDAAAHLGALALPLVGLSLVLFVLCARSHLLVPVAERAARLVRLDRASLGRRLLARARDVREALAGAGGEGRLAAAALVSVPLWLGVFAFYAVLARGMGIGDGTGLPELVFGSSLAVAFNLLPVNGLAGFGTQEVGWTFGFGLVGVASDVALATGLGAHFVQLLDVCVFGALAHLAMGVLGRPRGES